MNVPTQSEEALKTNDEKTNAKRALTRT